MADIPPAAPRRARWRLLAAAALVLALGVAAWLGWQSWQARQQQARAQVQDQAQQVDALGERLDTLRADLRAQGRLLQDAAASNRVLRDEVLGLGQRNALLEHSVARLDAKLAVVKRQRDEIGRLIEKCLFRSDDDALEHGFSV